MGNLRNNVSFLAAFFVVLVAFFLCFGRSYGYTHFFLVSQLAIVFASFSAGMLRGALIYVVAVALGFIVAQKSVNLPSQDPRSLGFSYFLQLTIGEAILIVFLLRFHAKLAKKSAETKRKRAFRATMSRKTVLAEVMGKLAHEVNNPLAILHASFLRYQAERLGGGGSLLMLEHMGAAQDRIQNVLKSLKTFSEGDMMEPMQEISTAKLLREMENQSAETARSHGAVMRLEYPMHDLVVRCRPRQIHFVLSTLLENACESMIANPRTLVIRVSRDRDVVRFEIEDNGRGIPLEIRDRIFQPFVTTKAMGQTMGMNLSVCNGIIKEHGGRMGFSPKAIGTIFWFELPLARRMGV